MLLSSPYGTEFEVCKLGEGFRYQPRLLGPLRHDGVPGRGEPGVKRLPTKGLYRGYIGIT